MISNEEKYEDYQPKIRARRGTAPRTNTRPLHTNAKTGFVIEAHLGRWFCVLEDGTKIWSVRARELGKNSIVVGDTVSLVGDISGHDGTLARIIKIHDRTTALRRSADDNDPAERIVVAGCDQLLIVLAAASPDPKAGFIYRAIFAALSGGSIPIIAVTKTDQGKPDFIRHIASQLNISCFLAGINDDLTSLELNLAQKVTALFGQSGVGKSTLFNRLIPEAHRITGAVSAIGKGRHTSSTSIAYPYPLGGWLIDTPGLRSLGLSHLDPEVIYHTIPEISAIAAQCPRNCDHSGSTADSKNSSLCALRNYHGIYEEVISQILAIIRA